MNSLVEKVQEANGFTAINCEDGFRKDNRLWFGECSVCGESITNSARDGIWKHEIVLEQRLNANGGISYKSSKQVDYCPSNQGVSRLTTTEMCAPPDTPEIHEIQNSQEEFTK